MKGITNVFKVSLSLVGGLVGVLFPHPHIPLYILIGLLIMDYLTGMSKAIINEELSSRVGSLGIIKKMFILTIITLGAMIDVVLNLGGVLTTTVTFFYIANEALSILENSIEIGVPIPGSLRKVLIQLRDSNNEEE